MKNIFSNTLKSEKGTSIIFVLCTLLFLMIIGVSVLSAVSATNGNIVDSQTDAKLEIYTDSAIKTFSKSLKGNLGKQIVRNIVEKGIEKDESGVKVIGFSKDSIEIKNKNLTITGLPEFEKYKLLSNISINLEDVSFIEEIPAVPEIKDDFGNITGAEREPSILKMILKAEVNFKVSYSNRENAMTASYICEDILVKDNVDASDNLGEWRLVKIEKTE